MTNTAYAISIRSDTNGGMHKLLSRVHNGQLVQAAKMLKLTKVDALNLKHSGFHTLLLADHVSLSAGEQVSLCYFCTFPPSPPLFPVSFLYIYAIVALTRFV